MPKIEWGLGVAIEFFDPGRQVFFGLADVDAREADAVGPVRVGIERVEPFVHEACEPGRVIGRSIHEAVTMREGRMRGSWCRRFLPRKTRMGGSAECTPRTNQNDL